MIEKLNYKQIVSILLTLVVYTAFINWKAALLLVVAIGFHEQSHLQAAKYLGFRTKDFYMIPFVGGVAIIADKYKSYAQNAFVSIMGPVGGGLLAVVTAIAYLITKQPALAAAANFMALLNLFNLLPFSFMDGGQLMGTITYSINKTFGMVCMVISTILAVVVLVKINIVLGVVIGLFGGAQIAKETSNWRNDRKGNTWKVSQDYLVRPRSLTGKEMAMVIVSYVSLASLLIGLMILLNKTPDSNVYEAFFK